MPCSRWDRDPFDPVAPRCSSARWDAGRSSTPSGWADGLAGVTLDLDTAAASELFELARTSWAAAGRGAPWLTTSFWFALGERDAAREQVHRHLRHYMNWLPADLVDALAPTTGFAGSADELVDVLGGFAAIGADEVHLIPTSADPDQLARAAEVVEAFLRPVSG